MTQHADIEMSSTPEQEYLDEVVKPKNKKTVSLDELNGFWERQARRMARNPCTHMWTAFVVALGLSVVGMVVGEFSVSANTGGWESRGTLIADRQTQLMMAEMHQEELFHGGDEVWDELINNVQPGWNTDDDEEDDDRRRQLQRATYTNSEAQSMLDYLKPMSDRITFTDSTTTTRQLPFEMTPDMSRHLQETLTGCDMGLYTDERLTEEARLWPIWKTSSSKRSVLDSDVLRDICVAETNTQDRLEKKGLCFGCEDGCLPPYSVVLYARLVVPNGLTLDCDELAEAWEPYQSQVEEEWKSCVEDIKANPDSDGSDLPESCGPYFSPTMVEELFEVDMISVYSSSIFMTHESDVDALYEEVDNFDQGSKLVTGAYDTQDEDFNGIFLDDSLGSDMALAMASALVVAIAIIVHTRSPFITIMGLLQIILSFPLSYFTYKLVANLDFFPFLNFIGVFVIFALGAGDVFVAIDKWRNVRLEHPEAETELVAALALPNAASAMFLTTLTTAVAFFATAICPVAPVQMFAIFCGLLIVFDYIMNILLVFPALCIYDRAILTKGADNVSYCMTLGCCGYCKKTDVDEDETNVAEVAKTNETLDFKSFEPKLIHRLLLGFYKVLHKIRWPLFVFCAAALGTSTYVASTLDLPTSSDVRLLTEDYQFEQNYLWRRHLLSTALEKASGSLAFVIWGVKPADTGIQNNPDSWSQLVLDKSFDPSSEDAQSFLFDFCDGLLGEEFAVPVEEDYKCPIQRFDQWLEEQSQANEPEEIYTEHCNDAMGVPVASDDFDACMISWSKSVNETSVLSREGKVAIMFVSFTSRIRYDDHYDDLDAEWNLIEGWMKETNRQAPSGVSKGYFSSSDFWWYDTNGQMLQTAYSAVGIALGCSAMVVLLSSRSLVLTLFSTFTILYVLTSVTAMLVAMGWTLGFLESICFAILIGVSVDFVIHFSHAYASLPGDVDRGMRTQFALIEMGPSILATAVTTILSAIVMLFTVITFFQKFGLILCLTVLQACAGSFIVYLTMSACVGPSNPTYLSDKFCGSSKEEIDEDDDIGNTMRSEPESAHVY